MQSKFYLIIMFCLFLISSIGAQSKYLEANKQESSIVYKLTHPMHEIEAESKNSYCKIEYVFEKGEIKRVFVQIDAASFNSGNSNRDSHAMEVVDAITYPYVKFSSSTVEQTNGNLKVSGKMTFHGISNDISFNAKYFVANDKLVVKGHFDLSLTAFNIERPSLLMIPVNDMLKFDFVETFKLK